MIPPLTAAEQLERLNAEATARKKRERRKANEVKTRTIQRMQLQMTAPLDIGLDFHDQALGYGQEDILDLEMSRKQLGKKKSHADFVDLVDDKDGFESDEGERGEDEMDEDKGGLNLDDEEGKEADDLEAELDELYDAYQERMKERDAKYRVKEARRKDKSREEWHGIQQQDSDDHDDGDDSEGGYDVVQAAKARVGEDSDSDSDSESDHNLDVPFTREKLKRTRGADAEVGGRQLKKARTGQLETSRAASMWFDQEVFAGVTLAVGDDEDEDEDEEMHDMGNEDVGEGEEDASRSEGSADSEDAFEVVPQEDQDEEMWDVDDEDQDEIKRSKVQSTILETHSGGGS
jgi:AdoMet-dependent rRNA methyltransferase SPB1